MGRWLDSNTRVGILLRMLAQAFAVLVIAGMLLLLRELDQRTVPHSTLIHGLIDESGHILTALLVGIGVKALRLPIPVWSILLGGIILDVGHVLTHLGITDSIAGSTRDGTHSLVVAVGIATLGFLDPRRATLWLGLAIGAVTHLVRDMGTGAVPLLWPISAQVESTSFHRSVLVMMGVAIAAIGSGALMDTARLANGGGGDHPRA